MMGFSCCVVDCGKTASNSSCQFYSFPVSQHKIQQRHLWITRVRRINEDGSAWSPKPYDRICSDHFVGGKKSDTVISPNYAPSIFPQLYKVQKINYSALDRQKRFMVRRSKEITSCIKKVLTDSTNLPEPMDCDVEKENIFVEEVAMTTYADKECQIDESQFSMEPLQKLDPGKTFTCNKTITVIIDNATKNMTIFNEVQVQTDIILPKMIVIPSQKRFHSVGCNTVTKVCVDSAVNVQPQECGKKMRKFTGYESLKKEELLDLTGVSINTFEFLLERTPGTADNCKLSKEDRLLLLLMKLKTGLSFSSLSIFFGVHRTTVSKIVLAMLQYLASSTANLVFWPSKAEVQGTMPKCFFPDYSSTRVIIDCTEFKVQAPSGVDNRIHAFSWYKKGYTAKVLIGITPGGFICLKSKVAGGHKSDSQITIESGLIDLLEEGDVVLADKGFPEIRKVIVESGKSAFIVMPPFLETNKEFTKEETEETYKIASVRIHVERVMQRLKIYHILHKIPASLFHFMDDLLHLICVLVNLQPPIYADKGKEKLNE